MLCGILVLYSLSILRIDFEDESHYVIGRFLDEVAQQLDATMTTMLTKGR